MIYFKQKWENSNCIFIRFIVVVAVLWLWYAAFIWIAYKFVLKMIVKLKHDFINVSWVKEVTAAAINKSNWINWIKLLLARFIFDVVVLVFCTTIIWTDINCTVPKGKMTAWLLLIRQQPFKTFKSWFLFHSICLSLSLVFSFSLHSDSIQFYIIQPMWFTWVFNVTLETEEEADEAVRANGRTMKWKSTRNMS